MLPLRGAWRHRCLSRCSKRGLSLAYTLHEPHKPQLDHAPLIVLHGLFGSKQNNRSISKALARDLKSRVYALDLRNHGDSPHDAVHDYAAMADDLEEFIQQHDLRLPTLIGHSMGAKVAMTVALRSPQVVGGLIAVDNAPVDAILKSDFHKYVQGMRDIEQAQVSRQAEANDILKKYEEALPIRQFLLTNLVRSSDGELLRFRIPIKTLASSLDKMGDFSFNNPDEVRYDGPTLIVRGTKSHYVADDVLPLIGRFFPMFKLVDIDSGHWVISEKPEAFRKAVVEFLEDAEG
ncbi:hypothetical protein HO173_000293 [Letharia columbiana]|uniref:AB hydrolase-1 domain-containing protein n=1 Tax=Letharia columbiana TaxID=112416 RepID=A0A8H6G6Q4_9LECA|nr:uncharacterized protein HO173_000293 [Letharia columbiana]KAF6241582.1 hypothetical protein HO173_000293 [Letharia columbiana]